MSFNLSLQLLTLPGGVQLYTERVTAAEVPTDQITSTIILVHGLDLAVSTWYPIYGTLVSAFPESALLAYDWSGSGSSPAHPSRRESGLTFAHLVGDLDALIAQETSTGPVTLIAHSAGSSIATQFLLSSTKHTSRITHAVFIGGPLEIPVDPSVTTLQYDVARKIDESGWAPLIDSRLVYTAGPTTVNSRPVAAALLRAVAIAQPRGTVLASERLHSFVSQTRGSMKKYPGR